MLPLPVIFQGTDGLKTCWDIVGYHIIVPQ